MRVGRRNKSPGSETKDFVTYGTCGMSSLFASRYLPWEDEKWKMVLVAAVHSRFVSQLRIPKPTTPSTSGKTSSNFTPSLSQREILSLVCWKANKFAFAIQATLKRPSGTNTVKRCAEMQKIRGELSINIARVSAINCQQYNCKTSPATQRKTLQVTKSKKLLDVQFLKQHRNINPFTVAMPNVTISA